MSRAVAVALLATTAACASSVNRGGRTLTSRLPPGSILPLFAFLGLVDVDFNPKPALAEWDKAFRRPCDLKTTGHKRARYSKDS